MTAISRGQLSLGHRSCLRHCLRHTHEMRERTNCRRGCSFSFFSFMEYYTGKGRNGQDKKKKTCRETQHVKIDMERDASIIICRMVAVGENYNSTRDTEVVETKNIVKTADGAEADGKVIDVNSLVSMNMWGLTPEFLNVLEEGFKEFFKKEVPSNPLKAEYLIPIFIGELLEQGKMSVKVLKTNDTWYGMTYHEDVAAVKDSFKKMLENGVYKADLFTDL